MEKFPGYSGINSAISDLAAVISDKLAKADSQISELGVSCRPTTMVTDVIGFYSEHEAVIDL